MEPASQSRRGKLKGRHLNLTKEQSISVLTFLKNKRDHHLPVKISDVKEKIYTPPFALYSSYLFF